MLPDFPKTKTIIRQRHLKRFYDTHAEGLGPLMNAPQAVLHEGHRFGLIRENGFLDEMEWRKVKAEETIKLDDLENWTEEQIYAHYDRLATHMAGQQQQLLYEELERAVADVGNEIEVKGPPSGGALLRV